VPELPEVETTARLLRPRLSGRRIAACSVHWRRSLGGQSPRAFERAAVGARFAAVERRGKYLVLSLRRRRRDAGVLLCHLRMTGRLLVEHSSRAAPSWTRVSLRLDRGTLYFVDVRKFGRLGWYGDPDSVLSKLGPEPLGESFSAAWLEEALAARRRALKPLLLDQTFLAGLGNIYVDEALFRSRLHPLGRSDRVGRAGARRLRDAIRATLRAAIAREGSSFDGFYRTPEGNPGGYQEQFQVYGRAGEPCRRCGAELQRIVVAQRGTHLCPRCQPPPPPSRIRAP